MSLLQDVTDNQREAITHIEGPLLVVAGAGSGKTRVITRRIGYLMSQGVNPYNILAITFTNKASDEMVDRVKQFSSHKGLWVSTFHKMCSRILRSNIDRLGYS
ncbi:MAG: UvrD-helicase domain-containing protein, partial [Planctomycetota bacterium]